MSSRNWSCVALTVLLAAGAGPLTSSSPAQSRTLPRANLVPVAKTTTVDPCSLAGPDEMRQMLEGWMNDAFPIKTGGNGVYVTFSRPDLRGFRCPDLQFELRLRVRYQKTRGFPQYSTTGQARLRSNARFAVSHEPVEVNKNVSASRIKRAFLGLSMHVIAVNLRRVPNWVESEEFIRSALFPALGNSDHPCLNISSWLKQQVEEGRDLPAGRKDAMMGLACP